MSALGARVLLASGFGVAVSGGGVFAIGLDPATGSCVEEGRAFRKRLPRTIFPNETVEVTARVVAPARSGAARLRMTLVQEGVSWFDDHDPSGALEGDVEIGAAVAPPLDDSPVLI